MKTNRLKKLAVIIVVAAMFLATGATIQAQEPPPDTPGAWHIYPGGSEHWVGNDRYSATWGSDLHNSIHEALGYSGQLLYPGPNNDDIGYWENYNPPPEGTIIELRGPGVWTIGGDGAQGGQGREKMKSLVVQQNGITIRGQDYDDGTGTMVQQEILFNNGATTALFYLEASDLTVENLHISGTWPSNSGGYALAVGRYTMIGPDRQAAGLTVTGNTFTNVRAPFDTSSPPDHPDWSAPIPFKDVTIIDNTVNSCYYNFFKKYGATFEGNNVITGNTLNHVGEGKGYPTIDIRGHTGTTCIDSNTFNGWRTGQYAIEVTSPLGTPIGIGENNDFVDQVGGSGAGHELYPLTSGGHAVGAPSKDDVTGCAAANEPPVADANGPYLGAVNSPSTFNGTGSSDPDGDSLAYAWDFGDSNTGTGATPTHSYALAGIYDVCLTVNDGTVDSDPVCTIAVVYDPEGGFVTGGGWIDSPPGAYMPSPSGIVVVTEENVGVNWSTNDTRYNGYVAFVEGPGTPPLGIGSLEMGTTASADKAQLFNYDHIDMALADIEAISYATYRNSASTNPPAQYPALNIEVDYVGDGSSYTTLVWEPIYAYGQSNLAVDTWQTWDTMAPSQTSFGGGWWSTKDIPGVCAFNCFVDWGTIVQNNPNAKIKYGFGVNVGSGWDGNFIGAVDALTLSVSGGTVTYDFEPVAPFDPTGKATFGFVSKYKKGAQTPEGNTEFVFKAADLNFHSDSYDWLVIAGAKAMFKGIGTINGEGEYKFMLTALDADLKENDGFDVDRFRIKIWSEDEPSNETVVYDNGLGADDDDGNATTEIGGGSIVIHTKKK